jgi:hypothetical protein
VLSSLVVLMFGKTVTAEEWKWEDVGPPFRQLNPKTVSGGAVSSADVHTVWCLVALCSIWMSVSYTPLSVGFGLCWLKFCWRCVYVYVCICNSPYIWRRIQNQWTSPTSFGIAISVMSFCLKKIKELWNTPWTLSVMTVCPKALVMCRIQQSKLIFCK